VANTGGNGKKEMGPKENSSRRCGTVNIDFYLEVSLEETKPRGGGSGHRENRGLDCGRVRTRLSRSEGPGSGGGVSNYAGGLRKEPPDESNNLTARFCQFWKWLKGQTFVQGGHTRDAVGRERSKTVVIEHSGVKS